MLESLSVRNYVLIDNLSISFGSGFSVLTGETGSGKSIMLGALSLLLGAKADREAVRKGADSAEISGVFSSISPDAAAWAEEHGIELEDGALLIRRLIRVTGRSAYTVNGSPVTVKEGEELGHLLVDVSSQHSHQMLLRPGVLRALLDEAAGTEAEKEAYRSSYRAWQDLEKEIRTLREDIRKAGEESDYMRFALSELDKADLREGEEETLRAELDVMNSSVFLKETLSSALSEMRSASSAISEAMDGIRAAARKDQRLAGYADRAESLSIEAEDIALSLRDHLSSIDFPEAEIEERNARLSELQRIRRRYGGSIGEAMRRRDDYRTRLEAAENGSAMLEDLERRAGAARQDAEEKAAALLSRRKKGGAALARGIESTLHKLGMPSAAFMIECTRTDTMGPDGMDAVSFLIAPNRGEKLSLLEDTASGGELSRVMLAMKSALSSSRFPGTMLFDEIDAGIGGTVANAVGDELVSLSSREQVIAITHLPQIAARAEGHFLVEKREEGGRTLTSIRAIEGEERVREIARLLSGETSGLSLEHARMLLEVQGR